MIVRLFARLIVLVLAIAVIRRSLQMAGAAARPGGRGRWVTWLGFAAGGLAIFWIARSCMGGRL